MSTPSQWPSLSVVIPTHNRREGLRLTLEALCGQDFPPERFEVIIVADGCTDSTAEMVWAYSASFRLTCLEQEAGGPARARNTGAAAAEAPVLLFLDDDIEAAPTLIRGHLEAHEKAVAEGDAFPVVIGYLPTILGTQKGLFRAALRGWWEEMFQTMAQPGHRFAYTDLLSGNFSVSASEFWEQGGFETSLRCHEDYELGYRLIRAGAHMRFERAAMGWHHEKTEIERSLRRKRDEGRADIALGTLHPELRLGMLMARLWNNCTPQTYSGLWMLLFALCSRLVRRAAFSAPGIGDAGANLALKCLNPLEGLRLRLGWRLLLDALMAYWYWRGVAEAKLGLAAVDQFLHNEAVPIPDFPLEIDLSAGIPTAEALLDRERPASSKVCFGPREVGLLNAVPGAEPLRGVHLRAALATRFAEIYGDILRSQDETAT